MSEPFVGEIRIFPYNFAPRFWAFCDGQSLPISENPMLYSIISDLYGGDGVTSFAVPNLMARAPLHVGGASGAGPGLSYHQVSEHAGFVNVALSVSQIPEHTHQASAVQASSTTTSPAYSMYGVGNSVYKDEPVESEVVPMSVSVIQGSGGSQPHPNQQPYLVMNYCIALSGAYPARN